VVWYLDTSAFLKLIVAEPETPAMRTWLSTGQPCWSSQLLRTEALRAASRLGIDEQVASQALEVVSLITPSPSTFLSAGRFRPLVLRSLDAIHLAAALELGQDLDGLVTYDARVEAGARVASIRVLRPV
jgi:predicted nucleic acid-binding protein